MTKTPMKKNNNAKFTDINETLLHDASDILLFLSDSFAENKHKMTHMELLYHVENAAQDVVYNLTQTLRNLTAEMEDED